MEECQGVVVVEWLEECLGVVLGEVESFLLVEDALRARGCGCVLWWWAWLPWESWTPIVA